MTSAEYDKEHGIAVTAARDWLAQHKSVPTSRFERERFEVLVWKLVNLKEFGERLGKDVTLLSSLVKQLQHEQGIFNREAEVWLEY